jgi:hypothetical protein
VAEGPAVTVTALGRSSYQVDVGSAGARTSHTVAVPEGLASELGWGQAAEADLVRESFAFLLEREPATSILRTFSLEVIGRYFPDFPAEIRRRRRG